MRKSIRLFLFQLCLAACWLLVFVPAAMADSAAPPTFSPPAGTYATPQSVTISTATAGASIRYTTDGSTPSDTEGTLYTGPVSVTQTGNLKAIAYASGLDNSTVSSASYTILGSGPLVGSLWPPAGSVGTLVTLTGANFGSSQGSSTVTFNGTPAGTASFWSANIIRIAVPSGAASGNVVVTVDSVASNARAFTVASPPTITTVSPSSGSAGTSVTVSGSGFGSTPGTGAVWLGSTYGAVSSWSDTEIVATVATGSNSGLAQVRQGGVWSNAVSFDVIVPVITDVSPSSGPPGTQVTITGTGFGSSQGDGQVWLGTANGTVQSWSATEIVATVASTAASGQVQVLQNGVWSGGVPFDVDRLHLSTIDPASGAYSTSVTFTGTGFGAAQGSGKVWLGSAEGTVVSWSDTEIVAAVASGSLTGVARVQQDGEWSNALAFTVPSLDAVTLVPNLMNLEVGDTHTIQALDSTGQPVTGLTWDSSDTGIVSLSAADPPVLTAVAAGRATITAGTASADVTVSATALPPGTVLWSNPGVGAAVYSLVPAVPSSEGVADVFAFHGDGTVEAVTGEGVTAWTADVNGSAWYMPGYVVPDFQGGLVYVKMGEEDDSVVRLDGITGQPTTLYTVSHEDPRSLKLRLGVHPDGTIFVVAWDWTGSNDALTVMGFDPAGGQKFTVSSPLPTQAAWAFPRGIIVAGDGNAYVPYSYSDYAPYPPYQMNYLKLLRVSSDGAAEKIDIFEWSSSHNPDGPMIGDVAMITNADEGAVLSFEATHASADWSDWQPHLATISGSSASVSMPGGGFHTVTPLLQLEDGSFVGTASAGSYDPWGANQMIAFNSTGAIRWSAPGYTPKIATADGGVLAADSSGSAVMFDENGMAVGMTPALPTYSWKGAYQTGSVLSLLPPLDLASYLAFATFAAVPGGNLAGNGFALAHHTFGLVFCGPAPGDGQCTGTTNVGFSYQPAIDDTNYTQAVDFSSDYPDWARAIKSQAYNRYKAAFAQLPAIVAAKEQANPLYGGSTQVKAFEYTNYISGAWALPNETPRWNEPYPPNGWTPNWVQGYPHYSRIYYLPIMGNAQVALGYVHGDNIPVRPVYNSPPMTDPVKRQQFAELTTAIGYAIGNIAAHETGHQLSVPGMDCKGAACEADDVYQNASSGSNHEWWYAPVPGMNLHWSQAGRCAIQKYLLGSKYRSLDGSCR